MSIILTYVWVNKDYQKHRAIQYFMYLKALCLSKILSNVYQTYIKFIQKNTGVSRKSFKEYAKKNQIV